MGREQLQSLLKERFDERARHSPGNIFFDQEQKDSWYEQWKKRKEENENAIDTDIRKRNTALELQKTADAGQAALQGIIGDTALKVKETENVGALARQRLISESSAYTADQGLRGDEIMANAAIEATQRKRRTAGQEAYDAWAKGALDASPEDHIAARKKFSVLDQKAPTDFGSFDGAAPAPTTPEPPQATSEQPPTTPARQRISITTPEETDYTGMSEEELNKRQSLWVQNNPNTTAAGNSPKIVRRKQLAAQLAAQSEKAAIEKSKSYNQGLAEKAAISNSDEVRKKRREQLGGWL